MSDLQNWENIIKEKRKKTEFRDFVKNVSSWASYVLHKNDGIITRYPKTSRIKGVLKSSDFENSRETLTNFGNDYDFNLGFFENIKLLMENTYFPDRIQFYQNTNADFGDVVMSSKNIYLSYVVINNCENILYSLSVKDNCNDVLNCIFLQSGSQNCYMSFGVISSFKIFYSNYIRDCNNIRFSSNLTGCSECIFCNNLENANYYVANKKYEKEDYLKIKKNMLENQKDFFKYYLGVGKKGNNYGVKDVEGNFIIDSENVENGYNVYNLKNGRNIFLVGGGGGDENMYDTYQAGSPFGDNFYGVCGAGTSSNLFLSCNVNGSSNIYYCLFLEDCSFCIGCIGLKNKSFCILNKQYSKEEWLELADKIFSKMDKDGILGDFFPGNLNPFYFNDTMAYLIADEFTKEEVEKDGFLWRNETIKVDIPKGAEIIETKDLNKFQGVDSNGIWQINPEILKKVIKDENGNIYKIVKMEYEFLVKYALPLPEIHWLDRIKMGFRF